MRRPVASAGQGSGESREPSTPASSRPSAASTHPSPAAGSRPRTSRASSPAALERPSGCAPRSADLSETTRGSTSRWSTGAAASSASSARSTRRSSGSTCRSRRHGPPPSSALRWLARSSRHSAISRCGNSSRPPPATVSISTAASRTPTGASGSSLGRSSRTTSTGPARGHFPDPSKRGASSTTGSRSSC